jgi:hypothetical protein
VSEEDTEIGISERGLKPCPFCGGPSRIGIDTDRGGWRVWCRVCPMASPLWPSDFLARTFWNKRDSRHAEFIEEVKER